MAGVGCGWVDERQADLPALLAFQDEVKQAGFTQVLLLGMGGSSLGPEVLAATFGRQRGYPELLVLDSTDPQQVATVLPGGWIWRRRCAS